MSDHASEALLQKDHDKLIAFHRTLMTLDIKAKGMAERVKTQATQPAPDYALLAKVVRELRQAFETIEKDALAALPKLYNPQAAAKATAYLDCFQWQQTLRHYAIVCAAEALEEGRTLSALFIENYGKVLKNADNLAPKAAAAFVLAYDVLGIDKERIDFERGGLKSEDKQAGA